MDSLKSSDSKAHSQTLLALSLLQMKKLRLFFTQNYMPSDFRPKLFGLWCFCILFEVWKLQFLFIFKRIGGKQQEQQPGYSWEFSHLSSAEVDTSYCFLNTWRWLNNVFEFKFSYNQPKHRHYDHSSSDESERNNVVIVSIKTINRCPHVITHLREVTYSM